jgi:dnd system-associated protein 4
MRDVRRPESLEPVVERLTDPKFTDTGEAIFTTIMDLLVFASGIGLHLKRRTPVPSSGKGIPIRIFENNQNDGYIYLVALADKREPTILATENDDEIVKIFEEYAAAGLEEIALWLRENPTDISGIQTLIAKLQTQIPKATPPVSNPSPV